MITWLIPPTNLLDERMFSSELSTSPVACRGLCIALAVMGRLRTEFFGHVHAVSLAVILCKDAIGFHADSYS